MIKREDILTDDIIDKFKKKEIELKKQIYKEKLKAVKEGKVILK